MWSGWLTPANAVTLLRLLLAPALVWALLAGAPLAAGACFALAVASDLADGHLARRRGEASPLGGLVDHAVDATFVTAATAALAHRGELPLLLPALIALAFAQYALDSRWLAAGGLRASALGRWNGIAYYAAAGVPVARDALGLAWPGPGWVRAGGWLLVASTLLSMAERLRLLWQAPRSGARSEPQASDSAD